MKILKLLTEKRLIGNIGERAAIKSLRKNHYKILSRNFVGAGHEIDIIAQKDGVTVFVEVKTRTLAHDNPREPRPASSVTPKKQKAIISAAREFLARTHTEGRKRFDVIEVYLDSRGRKSKIASVNHLKNAFNLNSAYSLSKG